MRIIWLNSPMPFYKLRMGNRAIKRYDEVKIPYQGVLASSDIKNKTKIKLKSQYDMLNPIELKRKITKLQNKLLKLNSLKGEKIKTKRRNLQVGTSTLLLRHCISFQAHFYVRHGGVATFTK